MATSRSPSRQERARPLEVLLIVEAVPTTSQQAPLKPGTPTLLLGDTRDGDGRRASR